MRNWWDFWRLFWFRFLLFQFKFFLEIYKSFSLFCNFLLHSSKVTLIKRKIMWVHRIHWVNRWIPLSTCFRNFGNTLCVDWLLNSSSHWSPFTIISVIWIWNVVMIYPRRSISIDQGLLTQWVAHIVFSFWVTYMASIRIINNLMGLCSLKGAYFYIFRFVFTITLFYSICVIKRLLTIVPLVSGTSWLLVF